MDRIYLDHAATTPIHPDVAKVMLDVMVSSFGNPSSIHHHGRETRAILDRTRETMANSIGAKQQNIIFTSGGTEADNLAVIGYAEENKNKGMHIITTSIEHHAVLHSCNELEKRGFEVTYLPVDQTGTISLDDLSRKLRADTILVSIMYGNNEVGTIQPIKEVGEILSSHQAAFHTDAVQAYGAVEIDVDELQVDMLSVSAHKINGPKGMGFLYVRDGVKLAQRMIGGEQERKRRAGTENVPGAAGFGTAVEIMRNHAAEKRKELSHFKTVFLEELKKQEVDFCLNGTLESSLPHVLNVSFPATNVESLLVNLDLAGISASSGSACTAGSIEPSHVLVAMFGSDSERITNSVRFSFGLGNTAETVKAAAEKTGSIINRLKKQ
ncbi:cysteine desulfurase family protein [Bacillus massilinigeriensis]|uniref:cysteine desulfurase family protein n=1 Tax=Bacillus mediterraneensis TaxID=1805474 RepID=UPI0008F820C2|nr:cysteine desulfurase family protein [Bacillus mediterraneensis]